MCGVCGILNLRGEMIPDLEHKLRVMSRLIAHRGPDDAGSWVHPRGHVGLGHRRLSIFDHERGHQPMSDPAGRCLSYNGEVYNHPELRAELGREPFQTTCDTEVVLRAHERWGIDALTRFRGMFAYALWDEPADELVLVRDRFGIKPLYYADVAGTLYFASEAKALLPFLPSIDTDLDGFKDYLYFQLCLGGKTLFKGVRELLPGHVARIGANGQVTPQRYWEVYYDLDLEHTSRYFEERIAELVEESVALHLRADVPVAAYLSGGLDSSAIASLAGRHGPKPLDVFTGKFSEDPGYDESRYARALSDWAGLTLHETDISSDDFVSCIEQLVYQLDYPVAGPGAFPQFVVSRVAREHVKVILGGQGGDEVFGGYTRYLIAYFEQCIKAAIDGTMHDGHFVVTYESIIPNLTALRSYKPLMAQFWREGMFEDLDARYFRLINRVPDLDREVDVDVLSDYSPFEAFREIFNGSNVGNESYFDKMTHFDFKTLLPALLHVEDRVSMAHGLESRVPLLDHRLVELAATTPADIKFRNGEMKHVFRKAVRPYVPDVIAERRDKMGFPVPLAEWMRGTVGEFVRDVFSSRAAVQRDLVDNRLVAERLDREQPFGRKTWGLLCLELWQQRFHDREHQFKGLLTQRTTAI
jgi:asparagine synthase (glutamine-hydrolysing)